MQSDLLLQLRDDVLNELNGNILPFWLRHSMDEKYGGFIGRMTNDLRVDENAPKGLVLNTRLLWTFSAAYRFKNMHDLLLMADRAYDYIIDRFFDREYGGAFWLLDYQGNPLDDKKKVYGQAFAIYALVEYAFASGDSQAFYHAKEIYELIEERAADPDHGGYFETFHRDWSPAKDSRLSEVDLNEKKSMNTHLHLLEAYTHLYQLWPDKELKQRILSLVEIFLNKICNDTIHHLRLFFDEKWQPKSNRYSFGHDIEASWLLYRTAEVLDDPELISKIEKRSLDLVKAVLNDGRDEDGAIFYESDGQDFLDTDKHWWPQAETVVGLMNACQMTGESHYCEKAIRTWQFIEQFIVDHEHGEWFWKVSRYGEPDQTMPKVSEWKGPYHNARACMEIVGRIDRILRKYGI